MLDMAHQFFNRRPPAQIAENVGDRMRMKLRQDESKVTYVGIRWQQVARWPPYLKRLREPARL